jgi:branched-chain amino acid transport system permease protein
MDDLRHPEPGLFGQLLLGLINGSFYAVLSLGLAVIFGLLNIINFAHGAQYMLGAFVAWMLAELPGHELLGGAAAGAAGGGCWRGDRAHDAAPPVQAGSPVRPAADLRAGADPEGLFKNFFGVSGESYEAPEQLQGGVNLGFMFLPLYRGWVVVASLRVPAAAWYVIERTSLGATLRAATSGRPGAGAGHQRAGAGHRHLRASASALAAFAGVLAAPICRSTR